MDEQRCKALVSVYDIDSSGALETEEFVAWMMLEHIRVRERGAALIALPPAHSTLQLQCCGGHVLLGKRGFSGQIRVKEIVPREITMNV